MHYIYILYIYCIQVATAAIGSNSDLVNTCRNDFLHREEFLFCKFVRKKMTSATWVKSSLLPFLVPLLAIMPAQEPYGPASADIIAHVEENIAPLLITIIVTQHSLIITYALVIYIY